MCWYYNESDSPANLLLLQFSITGSATPYIQWLQRKNVAWIEPEMAVDALLVLVNIASSAADALDRYHTLFAESPRAAQKAIRELRDYYERGITTPNLLAAIQDRTEYLRKTGKVRLEVRDAER